MSQIKKLSEQHLRRMIQDLLQEAFKKEEKDQMMSFVGELDDIVENLDNLHERILGKVQSLKGSDSMDTSVVTNLKTTLELMNKIIKQQLTVQIDTLRGQIEESMTLEKQPSTSPAGKRLPPPLPTKR